MKIKKTAAVALMAAAAVGMSTVPASADLPALPFQLPVVAPIAVPQIELPKIELPKVELPSVQAAAPTAAALPGVQQAAWVPTWKNEFEREQWAFNRMKDTISIGTGIGSIAGAALGCAVGVASGIVATFPVGFLLGTGPVAGCIVGAAALGVAGTLLVGIPVAVFAIGQYITIVNSPF